MLQQTQVATVRDRYYFPFLKTFPTIQALAAAPREKVLKAWEGLGYYRRAGFLHDTAKKATKGLPDDVDSLRALPGIGKNTAHAILTFAHKQPYPVMEANVKRIVARIFALESPTEDQLWAGATALLNTKNPFDHNQAMMDLGALICTPKRSPCAACPATSLCKGKHAPQLHPAPKAKKKIPTRRVHIHVSEDTAGRLYLESRQNALLGGLYGFPQTPLSSSPRRRGSLSRLAQEDKEIPACAGMTLLGNITHTYSHFKLEGAVHHRRLNKTQRGKNWFTREQIAQLPLSRADHKVLALLGNTARKK